MFENIFGNNSIKKVLEQSIYSNKVSHSYLMIGISGIGKKMIATEFAKGILCLSENKSCNYCKSCIEFDGNNNPDFFCIEPEGSSIKIGQIRELQKRIQEKPIISEKKVYIIDQADLMTKEAQNCLLKTLEEPPEYITIILVCSNEDTMLSTIKSRCTRMHFEAIENSEVKKFININYPDIEMSDKIIELAQGSIGKAIKLNGNKEVYENIEKILLSMQTKDIIDVIQMSEGIYKSKEDIKSILEYMNVMLLELSRQNKKYINCIEIVEDTKKRLKANSNYDMCIDNLLFNMKSIIAN